VHAESSAGAVSWSLFRTYADAIEHKRSRHSRLDQPLNGYATGPDFKHYGSRGGIDRRTDNARRRAVEFAQILRTPN